MLQSFSQVIDMRSFSTLWYWIAVAMVWSMTSHRLLGVPYDMVRRARHGDAATAQEVATLAEIGARRVLRLWREGGATGIAVLFFLLTMLLMAGFYYGNEFAQAVSLMAVPLLVTGAITLHIARGLGAALDAGAGTDAVIRALLNLRWSIRIVGIVAVLCAAFWGAGRWLLAPMPL